MNLLSFLKSSYYSISGKKPFSTGYGAFKNAQILKILKNKNFKLLDIPPSYGIRIDERIIEYPWLFSKLPMDKGNLLDAGSVLNFDYLLSQATLKSKQIVIYTLSPEQNCFFKKGISYHYGDLRDIPYKNQFFDWVVSLSTIEHIGLNNTRLYSNSHKDNEKSPSTYLNAIKEYQRVLKPGGTLYLSVPYGKHLVHDWFQVFNGKMLDQILEAFKPSDFTESIFKYTPSGWTNSSREEAKNEIYFDYYQSKKHDPDFAAAARAVACIELKK